MWKKEVLSTFLRFAFYFTLLLFTLLPFYLFTFLPLKKFVCLTYHLVLVYQLHAIGSSNQIVTAVLATTPLATYCRDDVARGIDRDGITRQFLYPTDKESLRRNHPLGLGTFLFLQTTDRIREDNQVTKFQNIAVNSIHYHSVPTFQLWRKASRWHREDSENVCADCPNKEQCQSQRYKEFYCYFQMIYLMLSTNWKSLFQRMPWKPGWSGL